MEQSDMDSQFYYDAKKSVPVLWQPEHAMLYDVTAKDDTSSNQAIKDPG